MCIESCDKITWIFQEGKKKLGVYVVKSYTWNYKMFFWSVISITTREFEFSSKAYNYLINEVHFFLSTLSALCQKISRNGLFYWSSNWIREKALSFFCTREWKINISERMGNIFFFFSPKSSVPRTWVLFEVYIFITHPKNKFWVLGLKLYSTGLPQKTSYKPRFWI